MASSSASLRSDICFLPVTGLVAHAAPSEMTAAKRKQVPFDDRRLVQPLYQRIQGRFEGARQQIDQFLRRARPHQADAQYLAGQRPEAGADLDVEVSQQVLPHRRIVHALRNAHRVERPQALAFGGGSSDSPMPIQRRRRTRRGCARGAPIAPRAPPLRRDQRFATARRRATPTSCGDTCAAPSSPRAARRSK